MSTSQYRSLQSLVAGTTVSFASKMMVIVDPATNNGDPLAAIDVTHFQSQILVDVNNSIAALEAKPGNGAFASPITMTLTGAVTGSAAFDGSANFSVATTIPAGSIAISSVNGLAASLAALQTGPVNSSSTLTTNDTRTAYPIPFATGYKQNVQWELKSNTVINRPAAPLSIGGGTYTTVMTASPWTDNTGGFTHELGFNGSDVFHRSTTNQLSSTHPWPANTAQVLTTNCTPSVANGFFYRCTTAGTTGTTEPVWPTTAGATVTDGTVVWTAYWWWGDWGQILKSDTTAPTIVGNWTFSTPVTVGAPTAGGHATTKTYTDTNFTSAVTTYLGKTGGQGSDSATNTAALWSALPIGYARFMNTSIGTAGGLPVTNYGYFFKMSNRDVTGGWAGLFLVGGSSIGDLYYGGAPDNATLPAWTKLWTPNNDGAGSGMDADLLDGQHGAFYQAWANMTGVPTLALTGPVTGSVSLAGSGTISLATTLNTSNLALATQALGTAAYYADMNAASQTNVLGNWNPSTLNIAGMDTYGTIISASNNGSLAVTNGNWINQLCFGTNGTLMWRYNINAAGWNTVKIWHSGNFTPGNYVTGGSSPQFGTVTFGSAAGPLLYESDGTNHSLGVRTGPSSAYKFFAFGYDGSFGLAGNVTTQGEFQSTNANFVRGVNGSYGVFWRFDGGSVYLLRTASGSQYGSWDATRPFAWSMSGGITTDQAWTMYSSLTVNTGITVGNGIAVTSGNIMVNRSNGEGDLGLGQNDYYLFGNGSSYGLYSASGGMAYGWTMSSRVFTTYGTFNNQSDERVKEGFEYMEPRPLWRKIEMEKWFWIKHGMRGYGPRAQSVLNAAPEYVDENKEHSVLQDLGGTKRQIAASLKRIKEGKELGMLSVNKLDLGLEMSMAAGREADAARKLAEQANARAEVLAGQVKALTKLVQSLVKKPAKKAKKKA